MKVLEKIKSHSYELNLKWALIFAIVTHFIAVIFTEGYHRPDEHLGIFRLMSFKLGTFPEAELSWEYPVKIRPWLQPGLFYLFSKAYFGIGMESPFILAFLFRLISSALALWATFLFIRKYKYFLNDTGQKFALWFTVCLSYFPFFHARSTAENWGITIFLLGLVLLIQKDFSPVKNKDASPIPLGKCFLAGLLFGASFILRYQMGVMVFFSVVWLLVFHNLRFLRFSIISLGISLFIAFNVLIDYWGYGTWTFSPWNYIYQNLVLDKVSGFGTSPVWYYLTKSLAKGVPPLSLFFIVPFLYFWIKKPLHFLTWATLPFILIHTAVGHKELRFIFGVGAFIPIMLVIILEKWKEWKPNLTIEKSKWVKGLVILCLIQNFGFLLVSSFKPAFTPMPFYRHVYDKDEKISKMYTLRIFRDQLKFYLKNPVDWIPSTDLSKVEEIIDNENAPTWFLTNKYSDIMHMRSFSQCEEDYLSYPNFVFKLNVFNWMKRSKIWALYRCESL